MKNLPDISASLDTHLDRASIVLKKHVESVNAAVIIISAVRGVVRIEGVDINLEEMQEQVLDTAEILDSLRQDVIDILEYHTAFALDMTQKIKELAEIQRSRL